MKQKKCHKAQRQITKRTRFFYSQLLPGMCGSLDGKRNLKRPSWICQSITFMLAASTLISTSSFAGVGTGNSTCYKILLHLQFSIHNYFHMPEELLVIDYTQELSMGCCSLPQFTVRVWRHTYCRTLRAETLPPKAEYCTACIVFAISLFLFQQDFFFFFFFSVLFWELGGIWRWPLEPKRPSPCSLVWDLFICDV